jgi:hypothetical protein
VKSEYLLVVVVLMSVLFCESSSAQFAPPEGGCPQGMHLEGFSCVYDQPVAPMGKQHGPAWASRWGAIAIDPTVSSGGIGVASDMKSQRAAEREAIKQCKKAGGSKNCELQTAYDNQCAVIVWGDTHYNTANAEDLTKASELALGQCAKKTSNCKIYYTNCTYPVRLR